MSTYDPVASTQLCIGRESKACGYRTVQAEGVRSAQLELFVREFWGAT